MFLCQLRMLQISQVKAREKPTLCIPFNTDFLKDDLRILPWPGCFKGRLSLKSMSNMTPLQHDVFDSVCVCVGGGEG